MEEKRPIPPRSEWKEMSITQLYDLKTDMLNLYYGMRASGATFAAQYSKFVSEIDALIQKKQTEADSNQD